MRVQAAHVPGARFQLVPEAGHSVNWEQPDVFNRAVLEFISVH
jgi:pimeloyl-ACP methyl ester carboxylesterase